MTKESIVFITAHPDDVAYACGGTAWLLREKYDLHARIIRPRPHSAAR